MNRVVVLLTMLITGTFGCGKEQNQQRDVPPVLTAEDLINPGEMPMGSGEEVPDEVAP